MRSSTSQVEADSPSPILIVWSEHISLSALQGRHLRHFRMTNWTNDRLQILIAELVCWLDFVDSRLQLLVLILISHIFLCGIF